MDMDVLGLNGRWEDGERFGFDIWDASSILPPAGGPPAAVTLHIVPEPATLSLLTLGGLAVLRRRRRR